MSRPDTSNASVVASGRWRGIVGGVQGLLVVGTRALAARVMSLRLWIRVSVGCDALDLALSKGADPADTAELAYRAARLVRARNRRALARCIRVAIWEAEAGVAALRVSPRPVRRGEVLACREALVALSERLESSRPVGAEGVAIAERLLADLRSPLFAWAEPGTTRRLALVAAAALDPPRDGLWRF